MHEPQIPHEPKVLVVDDEIEIVKAVSMRLRSAGYGVISARDGQMATQMALHEAPDLVILDIGMPCGDGHTVAQRLLAQAETMSTPIIFLTARDSEDDRRRAFQAGAIAYINKPFASQDLLAVVSRALAASKRMHSGVAVSKMAAL